MSFDLGKRKPNVPPSSTYTWEPTWSTQMTVLSLVVLYTTTKTHSTIERRTAKKPNITE